MPTIDSYQFHLEAHRLRTRHLRVAAWRMLRALRRWGTKPALRPAFGPFSVQ